MWLGGKGFRWISFRWNALRPLIKAQKSPFVVSNLGFLTGTLCFQTTSTPSIEEASSPSTNSTRRWSSQPQAEQTTPRRVFILNPTKLFELCNILWQHFGHSWFNPYEFFRCRLPGRDWFLDVSSVLMWNCKINLVNYLLHLEILFFKLDNDEIDNYNWKLMTE